MWKELTEYVPEGSTAAIDNEGDSNVIDNADGNDTADDENVVTNDTGGVASEASHHENDDGSVPAVATAGSPDTQPLQSIKIPIEDDDEEERSDDDKATQPVEVPTSASLKASSQKQKQKGQKHKKQKKYTGPSAGLMEDMKADSTAFLKTIEDPLTAILDDSSLPVAGSKALSGVGSGQDVAAGAGATKKPRLRIADHVDSGYMLQWDSDASDSSPKKSEVGASFPTMKSKIPSPLKRSSVTTLGGVGKQSRKRVRWSAEEENDLMEGVKKHGMGGNCWNNILEDSEYHFNNRSNVDLKDKHRNLVKKYGLTNY